MLDRHYLANRGKTETRFRVALAAGVTVSGKGGPEPVTMARGRATATVAGVDALTDGEDGKVLGVGVKAGGTARLRWTIGD